MSARPRSKVRRRASSKELGSGDVGRQPQLEAAELERLVGTNACLQARHDLETCGDARRLVPHPFGEPCLAHPVEHDAPAVTDLPDAPDGGNWQSQRLDRGVDRRFAERHSLGRRRSIELERTGTPFEHLGHIASGEQTPHGLVHRPPPETVSMEA
jgi:hypothetical protein